MKKIILSAFVVITFIAYALYDRRNPSDIALSTSEPKKTLITPSPIASVIETNTPFPTPTNTLSPTPRGQYIDGEYVGNSVDAFYGIVQVKAIVSGGKLTDVQFLQYPHDRRTSVEINSQAMPYLKSEAIVAQSANVNIISGATDTSQAFRESLGNALSKAKS